MLSRSPRGRAINAPAAFIDPCQPMAATKPPTGPGWAHCWGLPMQVERNVLAGLVALILIGFVAIAAARLLNLAVI